MKRLKFAAPAVVNGGEIVSDFTLDDYIGKDHVLLFFQPKDFTFVCPSELHAGTDVQTECNSHEGNCYAKLMKKMIQKLIKNRVFLSFLDEKQ